jgi:Holliday junction resolvase-like predicted endonuclease
MTIKHKSFLKRYSKLFKFENESEEHLKLRFIAYRWLWNRGYRAFASFVDISPFGLIDIVAIKKDEICIIDCETNIENILNKSRDVDQLTEEKIDQIEKLVKLIGSINTDENIFQNEDIQKNINILKNINMMLGDDNLYFRLTNKIIIANTNWVFYPHYISGRIKYVDKCGYVECIISNKTQDYRPCVVKQASLLENENLISMRELESKMLRSLSNELYSMIPDNIFLI